MYYAQSNNLLFIAAPKTGSTSVEQILDEAVSDGSRYELVLPDRVVGFSDLDSPSMRHAKATDFRAALGVEIYDELQVFGFTRDPIKKIVSSYFFTRALPLKSAFRVRKNFNRFSHTSRRLSAIMLARILPLSFWSLMYRMPTCYQYFTDEEGNVIVDYLGSTERLASDLTTILSNLGIELPEATVPHSNRSKHGSPKDYPLFRYMVPLLKRRYSKDLALHEKVKAGVWKKSDRNAEFSPAGS